jgi:hypothetical protein
MSMVVAFHVNAYFSLGGGVLLYFIVRVEVIEIQILFWIHIGLKFIKDLEKERRFSIFPSLMGRKSAYPQAQPSKPLPGGPAVCRARTRIAKGDPTR